MCSSDLQGDLDRRPFSAHQLTARHAGIEGLLLVTLEATGDQQVHLSADEGAKEGRGVAQGDEVDPRVLGGLAQ